MTANEFTNQRVLLGDHERLVAHAKRMGITAPKLIHILLDQLDHRDNPTDLVLVDLLPVKTKGLHPYQFAQVDQPLVVERRKS